MIPAVRLDGNQIVVVMDESTTADETVNALFEFDKNLERAVQMWGSDIMFGPNCPPVRIEAARDDKNH